MEDEITLQKRDVIDSVYEYQADIVDSINAVEIDSNDKIQEEVILVSSDEEEEEETPCDIVDIGIDVSTETSTKYGDEVDYYGQHGYTTTMMRNIIVKARAHEIMKGYKNTEWSPRAPIQVRAAYNNFQDIRNCVNTHYRSKTGHQHRLNLDQLNYNDPQYRRHKMTNQRAIETAARAFQLRQERERQEFNERFNRQMRNDYMLPEIKLIPGHRIKLDLPNDMLERARRRETVKMNNVGEQVKRALTHQTTTVRQCINMPPVYQFPVLKQKNQLGEIEFAWCMPYDVEDYAMFIINAMLKIKNVTQEYIRLICEYVLIVENLFKKAYYILSPEVKPSKMLGKGGDATVHLVELTHRGKTITCARKLCAKNGMALERFIQEIGISTQLSGSKFTTEFYGYRLYHKYNEIYCEMYVELCSLGCLSDVIETIEKSGKEITEQLVVFIITNMFLGLEFLQSKKIVHYDVKFQNCLVSNQGYVKLCDFGGSRQLGSTNIVGFMTYIFASPEKARNEVVGFFDDIWAVAVCLYYFCYGHLPFPHLKHDKYLVPAIGSKIMPVTPMGPHKHQGFLQKLLHKDLNQRLHKLTSIFATPFFRDINLTNCRNQVCPSPIVKILDDIKRIVK